MATFSAAQWPLAVVCVGMVTAAVIDGWGFKVPNWLTLPLIGGGWLLGLLHDLGAAGASGQGGLLDAAGGTALGALES